MAGRGFFRINEKSNLHRPDNCQYRKSDGCAGGDPDAIGRFEHDSLRGQLRQPLGEGERSFTEDLAHLIHSEARTSEAIYLALLLEEPLIPDVHSERQWGKLLRYDLLSCPDLLIYFKLRRLVLLRVLASLTE